MFCPLFFGWKRYPFFLGHLHLTRFSYSSSLFGYPLSLGRFHLCVLVWESGLSLSNICDHPFLFVDEMIWQAHHNSSQAFIGVDVCMIIETVHDKETIDDMH